jgi:thioredoxin-related protein
VFFEQNDCPDCDNLHEKVLSDPGIRKSLGQTHAVQLDMWSQTALITPDGKKTSSRDWAKALNVQYAPTIVLFDAHGREIIRSEAMFKVFHTHGIFDYVLSGGYLKQPSFQRWLSERADLLREQGEDVDIWSYTDEKPRQ